jgi:hypothetical protein
MAEMDEQRRAGQFDRALTAMQQRGTAPPELRGADHEVAVLLGLARTTRDAMAPDGPDQSFVATTRLRVLNRIRAGAQRPIQRTASRPRWRGLTMWRRPAFALASVALALVLLLSGTSVVYASSYSAPGDPLYGLKLGVEKVRLALTVRQESRVQLLTQYANRRLEELEWVEQTGQPDEQAAFERYGSALDELVGELENGSGPKDYERIMQNLEHHTLVLEDLLATAAPTAQAGLQNAIEKSSHSRTTIEALHNGRSPSEIAPGQLKKTTTPAATDEEDQAIPPGQIKKTQTPNAPGHQGNGPPDDRGGGPPDGQGGGPPEGRGNDK